MLIVIVILVIVVVIMMMMITCMQNQMRATRSPLRAVRLKEQYYAL